MNKKIVGTFAALVMIISLVPSFAKAAPSNLTPTQLTCAQTAVDARETSIGTAWSTYSTAMTTALSTRKTALHTAWGIADRVQRITARKASWDAFKTATSSAHSALKTAKNTAWSTWRASMAACNVAPVENPVGGPGQEL
jgi:hypothetical protein